MFLRTPSSEVPDVFAGRQASRVIVVRKERTVVPDGRVADHGQQDVHIDRLSVRGCAAGEDRGG